MSQSTTHQLMILYCIAATLTQCRLIELNTNVHYLLYNFKIKRKNIVLKFRKNFEGFCLLMWILKF